MLNFARNSQDRPFMKIKYVALALSFTLIEVSDTFAIPKNVIITRHAEKFQNDDCLSLQGLERASALVSYFSGNSIYNNPPISHVFAAYQEGPNPHSGQHSYIRAQQTCAPIADHLKLPLNSGFTPEQVKETAHEILTNPKYDNATVLMCWEHRQIDSLIEALGGKAPNKWPHDVFDQVYMLTYEGKGKSTFQQYLQKLMFGDRATFEDKPHPLPPIPVRCPSENSRKLARRE